MEAKHLPLRRTITLFFVLVLVLGLTGSGRAAPQQALSFIVQGQSSAAAAQLVEQYGGTVTSRLNLINGVGATLTAASRAALQSDPRITAISANAGVEKAGDVPPTDYPDVTAAVQTWEAGVNGTGVTVAVVDTGLGWHPALFKGIDGRAANRIVGWKDFVDNSATPKDPNGHGTHIAGIIANSQQGPDLEWNGMAPGVDLVGVRVLNEKGHGTYEQVIQGVQWVVDHKDHYNIRIINMSLLAQVTSPYWSDPLNQAVMQAWKAGIVVVVAAGNKGPGPVTVNVPGNNPYVITVGAFSDNYTPDNWKDDYITEFSAAGPTLDGFVKPDLVAPGAHMVSTLLPNTTMVRDHRENWDGGRYFSIAGTSQAAAVVSGASALVLSRNPELTPDQVKYRLLATALPWVAEDGKNTLYSMWQMGAGRVNAYDAALADIEGSANQGLDLASDLDTENGTHYAGYSVYEDGEFKLLTKDGQDFSNLPDSYVNWSGAYSPTAGGFGIWSGGMGIWSGGMGIWSGTMGIWSGTMGIWSGGFGIWSGGMGIWSGGMGIWSGGMGIWSGSAAANNVPSTDSVISIGQWVEEQRATP